ncbi:MAG: hypothetical protein A2X46_04615 [Lentisphaerae bacterium GWF2_57_35]|nr:MAG: hypothetical protein A2X46_04615 [Lentisphaerae bacterium GWF2_57_35]
MDIHETGFPCVAISRQSGAGGHFLGREILRQLLENKRADLNSGWEMFDQKLCAMLAQHEGGEALFQSLLNEEYRRGVHQSVYEMLVGRPEQYDMQKKIFEVIRLLALLGKVIIIGRGAVCVTQGMPQTIRIRLIEPEKLRLQHMIEILQKPAKEVLQIMHKQDRDREQMIRTFFNKDINDPLLYDLTWNTGTVDIQEMAAAVIKMLEMRMERLKPKRPA